MSDIVHGFRRGSFYNPATGTVVQTNHLRASGCSFLQEALDTGETDPTGGLYHGGDRSVLEWTFYDPDGTLYEQLKTWQEATTRLSFVAEGLSRNVQWYETDRLDQCRRVDVQGSASEGRADVVYVRMVREGHGTHDIHANVNLLAYLGWEDANGDGVPDRYTPVNLANMDFTTGTFAAYGPAGTAGRLERDIIFPITGAELTLSVQFDQLHADGDTFCTLVAEDYNGSTLTGSSEMHTSTGRKEQSLVTPSNAWAIAMQVVRTLNVTTQSQRFKILYPALRADGSDEHTLG